MDQIERITEMEGCLDASRHAADALADALNTVNS